MPNSFDIDEEFRTLIPPLADDERERLEASIVAEGVREPIVTWDGTIIDGHNRYAICQEHGLECPNREREFASREAAKIWIIENQFGRRNLNDYNRSVLALKLEPLYQAEAKRKVQESGKVHGRGQEKVLQNFAKPIEPLHTAERIAEVAGVSRENIRKVKKIEAEAEKGNPVAVEARSELQSGEKKSIHGAYVQVFGKPKPRKPEEKVDAEGKPLCVMCGEPIADGEEHSSARPFVHKKCEQEYQRDWVKSKKAGGNKPVKHRDASYDLENNVAVFDLASLTIELKSAAENLRDSWSTSIEINEEMGVKLTASAKKQLGDAVDAIFAAIESIEGETDND